MSKKIITAVLTATLAATLVPSAAHAAELKTQTISKDGKNYTVCAVSYTPAEKEEIIKRARAYAQDRTDFGKAVLPILAKKTGASVEDLAKLSQQRHPENIEQYAKKAGVSVEELGALLVLGRPRDPQEYQEKYLDEYSTIFTDEKYAERDRERNAEYGAALTDAQARIAMFHLEGEVSDAFKEILVEADGALGKSIAARYNLKAIGTELDTQCLAAIKEGKPTQAQIPAAKTAATLNKAALGVAIDEQSKANVKLAAAKKKQEQEALSSTFAWGTGIVALLVAIVGAVSAIAPQIIPTNLLPRL